MKNKFLKLLGGCLAVTSIATIPLISTSCSKHVNPFTDLKYEDYCNRETGSNKILEISPGHADDVVSVAKMHLQTIPQKNIDDQKANNEVSFDHSEIFWEFVYFVGGNWYGKTTFIKWDEKNTGFSYGENKDALKTATYHIGTNLETNGFIQKNGKDDKTNPNKVNLKFNDENIIPSYKYWNVYWQ